MIRAAAVLALLAGPAGAATLAECDALAARLPVGVGTTNAVAGVCLFQDVRIGRSPAAWRADRVTLDGDVHALPDALPRRLSGGVTGLFTDPWLRDQPGFGWLLRQQAMPGLSISFDMTSEAGVLRVNSFVLRDGDRGEVEVTARLAGVPEVWPVDSIAASAIRVQALDVEIGFDGLFERLLLVPLGTAMLDLRAEAPPQVAALRETAATFLAGFAGTGQAENAAQVQAFLDALPNPRGVLEIGLGQAGLSPLQLLPFATGTVTPDYVTRVADAAAVAVVWTPDE